jgi:tetratricopeptide (TPR) repeat protein
MDPIMATETALGPSTPDALGGAGPAWKQLWQVPTFFAGLLLVAGVVAAIPLRHGRHVGELDRDIDAIRRALAEPGASVEEVLAVAEKVLARTDHATDRAGEAHFLLGGVYQRLADHGPAARVALLRQRAQVHLEQAAKLGVPVDDRDKLKYRLAKAWFLNDGPVPRTIEYLTRSVDGWADDPAEGYRMLAQAYMRLPVPNLDAAYQATLKLLALPTDDEDVLGPARLLAGEILLRQQKPADALRMLETITSRAPRNVVTRARYLQARSCQELSLWDRAVPYWQEVLRNPSEVPGGRGEVKYCLGQCYHNREQPDDKAAAQAWEQALELKGDSGRAAALCLAELYLSVTPDGALANPAAALDAYRHVLDKVKSPKDYRNTLIDLERARDRIAWGCHVLRQYHDFESALKLADLYRRIALPGIAVSLEAKAAEAWAEQLLGQPRPTVKSDAAAWDEQIRGLYEKAGAAFEAAAAVRAPGDQPRMLWRSASCYLHARQYARAVAMLDRFVHHPQVLAESCGEGWFTLAETHLAVGRKDLAMTAYHNAIACRGPYAFRARLQLALAEMSIRAATSDENNRHLGQAQALLEQILDPVAGQEAPGDVRERSLFLLANLLCQRRDFEAARLKLTLAIDQYPEYPHILEAREQLAECYRCLADQQIVMVGKLQRDPQIIARQNKNRYLEQAVDHYQKLADDLDKRRAGRNLTDAEQAILRRTHFAVADCRFNQDNMTAEALRLYQSLAEGRFPNRVEALVAYQHMAQCAFRLAQLETARTALRNAWLTLDKLPDDSLKLPDNAFRGCPGPWTRRQWQDWISQMAKYLEQLTSPGGARGAAGPRPTNGSR